MFRTVEQRISDRETIEVKHLKGGTAFDKYLYTFDLIGTTREFEKTNKALKAQFAQEDRQKRVTIGGTIPRERA